MLAPDRNQGCSTRINPCYYIKNQGKYKETIKLHFDNSYLIKNKSILIV